MPGLTPLVQHLVLQIKHLKVTQEEIETVCVISGLITAMTYLYSWGVALMHNWAILKSKNWIVLGRMLKVETGQRFIFCLEEKTSGSGAGPEGQISDFCLRHKVDASWHFKENPFAIRLSKAERRSTRGGVILMMCRSRPCPVFVHFLLGNSILYRINAARLQQWRVERVPLSFIPFFSLVKNQD